LRKYLLLLLSIACSGGAPRSGDSTPAQANPAPASAAATDSVSRGRAAPATPAVARSGRRTIVFMGTSLTAGYGLDADSAYPQLVERMIHEAGLKYDVVNAGVSGETSTALLNRLDWLLREPFDVVVIETGANDGLRGIPVATMATNVQQILDRVKAARPNARIALIQMESPPNLGVTYTRGFREVFPELARKNGVVLLPFLLEGVAGVRELNQGDGIHPNYAGERIVAQNVWKGLRPMLQ
jgi:acyl-CoA thioesterase I